MDVWKDDLLGYKNVGGAYTNLIQSLDSSKVISIEAGFGRGKTFFRKAWSEQMRDAGEVVVEIDVQQSDHTGDPVVTFLGALVAALPKEDRGKGKKALDAATKLGAIGVRSVAKMVLKSGADELISAIEENAMDGLQDFEALDGLINDLGDGMSKAAGQLIASQMAAEKVRQKELPEQLQFLQEALTEHSKNKRVVVVIDELDRCHPDYAIALLEAMKLVFSHSGFVFCLMVNADYLENLAQHRFGPSVGDEKYLDKFVDIRLRLEPEQDSFQNAVKQLANELPTFIPFGEGKAFSVEHASELAGNLAVVTSLSMRKVKRVLLKVELALRCYSNVPLDTSLLVFLSFNDAVDWKLSADLLPRSKVTPEIGAQHLKSMIDARFAHDNIGERTSMEFLRENAFDLIDLPRDRYNYPDGKNYLDWAQVFQYLAPNYLPLHQDVLNSVAEIQVPVTDKMELV